MTERSLASIGPVFEVAGEVASFLGRDIGALRMVETSLGLRSAEFTLHAGSPGPRRHGDAARYLAGVGVDFGKALKIYLGPDEAQALVFEGTISAIEASFADGEPPMVTICAEDALMRLRMTRRMKTYTDVTDAEIAEEIAREHGLEVDAAAEGPRYDVVQQWNQSDLAFLRERARLIQAEIWCTGKTLHFATRDRRDAGELTLVQGNHLLDIQICADLAHQRSAVSLTGYDAQRKAYIDEEAGPDAITGEVPSGVIGPKLVRDALGPSASYRVREGALTSAEARAYARAEMLRRGRQFVTATGTTRGSSSMNVGTRLTLEHVGPIFEGGDYYVTQVTHTYDLVNGFRTRFEAERGYINGVS